jgi:hypothetical protein
MLFSNCHCFRCQSRLLTIVKAREEEYLATMFTKFWAYHTYLHFTPKSGNQSTVEGVKK